MSNHFCSIQQEYQSINPSIKVDSHHLVMLSITDCKAFKLPDDQVPGIYPPDYFVSVNVFHN